MKTIRRRLRAAIVELGDKSAPKFTGTAADFTPCSKRPNCVSSRAPRGSRRYIAPLRRDADLAAARQALLQIIRNHNDARIVTDKTDFIHAAFTSKMGFVDDVMFLLNGDDGAVDVKSASRLGYSDSGVNRRRVEALRRDFDAALARG